MAIDKEDAYFPRGQPASKKPALRKTKNTLFSKNKKTKKTKKSFDFEEKLTKEESKEVYSQTNKKHVITSLTYQLLQEGMVVMGRVREIWPYHMFICLPGRLSAKLPLAAISSPYSEALKNTAQDSDMVQEECPGLKELFRVGQPVVCSVVEVNKMEGLLAVSVSLEPSLVNKGLHLGNVKAGGTLIAAVQSREDHGYTLHTGISRVTTFLPHSHAERFIQRVNKGRPLAVGEVVRCLVTRCKADKLSSRVEVTLDPDALNRSVISNLSRQTLLPATRVRCTVSEVTPRGLVMSVEEGQQKAYVENSQLKYCWSDPDHYKPDTQLVASVLYTLPQSALLNTQKPVYLTLKDINEDVEPKISVGATVQAVVTSSGYKGVTLCLGDSKDNNIGNKGVVSVRRLGETMSKEEIPANFPIGKVVTARILAYDYMEQIYNCSLERDKLAQQYVNVNQVSVGDRVTCQVDHIEQGGLKLVMGSMKMYAFKDHSADVPYPNLYQSFARGDTVDCRVLKINPETRYVTVTMKETLIRSPALCSYEAAHVGDSYWGTVVHARDNSLYVSFYNDVAGNCKLSGAEHSFVPGQLVKCFITYVNVQDEKLLLSLDAPPAKQPRQLTVGDRYLLVVTDVTADHVLVSACDFDGVEGIVPKSHLLHPDMYRDGDFLKAWLFLMKSGKYHFSPNPAIKNFLQPVKKIKPVSMLTCCVAKVKGEKVTLYTPLPELRSVKILKTILPSSSNVAPLQIVKVSMKCITKLGTAQATGNNAQESTELPSENEITENDSENTAFKKHKREKSDKAQASNNNVADLKRQKLEKPNITKTKSKDSKAEEEVHMKDMKVPSKKKQQNNNSDPKLDSDLVSQSSKTSNKQNKHNKLNYLKRQRSDSDSSDDEIVGDQLKKLKINSQIQIPQTLTESDFQWDVKLGDLTKPVEDSVENKEDDEEDLSKGKKKKTAAERRRAAKEEEARLRKLEQSLMDSESNPQSADQFDRAVLARPDDAFLWIKYMSYHLQATEIEKARSVARRALQTINQRLETERLNVWIALLNLENHFGTVETLRNAFDEALRTNDEFVVHSKMLQIYTDAIKSQEAEQLVNSMVRKFRSSSPCWVHGLTALMKVGLPDKARALLQRAITVLPNKEHINLLCKFALLENQHGFGEQAQTLFEHILTSYPKRIDIWNVYVDMLVKSNKIEFARQILTRATRQKLPPRKMKMLFSKWVSFEEQHGTPETVERVRSETLQYVDNITKRLE